MSLSPGELEVVAVSDSLRGEGEQAERSIVGRSLWSIAWRRLKHDRVAVVAGVVIVVLILVAVFADALTALYGQSYLTQHNVGTTSLLDPATNMPLGTLGGISPTHWLGVTPVLGQDILSLLMFGARTSLIISGLATLLSLVLGVSLGLIAGYYRGWVDTVISRIMDVLLSFPTLLLSI
ncbi:MAG: hypothetical protein QOD05_2648, partial [Microbacteriaceae bacterium]|nr:hypothetical protein [Microbacteriaceae bacterium]